MIHRRQLHWALGLALFVAPALFLAAWLLDPAGRGPLQAEGGPVESSSVALWFLALGVSLVSLRLVHRDDRSSFFWGIPVLCALGALDELSFGMNILVEPSSYPVVLGVRIDALHDVNALAVEVLNQLDVSVSRTAGLAVVVLGAVGLLLRSTVRRAVSYLQDYTPLLYIFLAFLMASLALALDVLYDHAYELPAVVQMVEELLEMNAALTMLFAAAADLLLVPWRRRLPAIAATPEGETDSPARSSL